MGPTLKRNLIYTAMVLPILGLAVASVYLGLSRYRSHRFARVCVTGNEDLLKESGYAACAFQAPEGSRWYCDPRQLPVPSDTSEFDRCELKDDSRSLIVHFQPGA